MGKVFAALRQVCGSGSIIEGEVQRIPAFWDVW
jgi:hypothetical protein